MASKKKLNLTVSLDKSDDKGLIEWLNGLRVPKSTVGLIALYAFKDKIDRLDGRPEENIVAEQMTLPQISNPDREFDLEGDF